LWAVPIAIICAGLGILVVALGKRMDRLVNRNLLVWLPIVGVAVAILAILFSSITGESNLAVLFSGSRALTPLMAQADTLGLGVVAWLLLFKSTAWMLSMGSFKGGPVFPAIFIGVVAGMLASFLPGMTLSTAIPITVAATVVSVLRLPLSASVLALLVAGSAGLDAIPLIIIGMVVAYIVAEILRARFLEVETVDEAIEGSPS
jgi:hypothetical protein